MSRERVKSEGGGRFSAEGQMVTCTHCKGRAFDLRRGVLDTRGMAFLQFTWANRGSTQLICQSCGFLLTFADRR